MSHLLGCREFFDSPDEFMRFGFSWSDAETCKLSYFNTKLKFSLVKGKSILSTENDEIDN